MTDAPRRPLTRAEQEVCEGVEQGWGYARIAAWLGIAEVTVRVHVRNVADKLPHDEGVKPYQRVFLWLQHRRWVAKQASDKEAA